MNGRYVTGTGQVIINVHQPYQCHGPWCVIHNPAPGPWSDWPTHWVENSPYSLTNGWMGRVCAHGVIHPCVEDNVPTALIPHHADCDGCPCGPEHIGSRAMDAGRGVARVMAIMGESAPNPEGRPLDANGEPARKKDELSLREKFLMDQDEAVATEALNNLVGALINTVIAAGGDHPGRVLVSTAYLDQLNSLAPNQIKIVLQYACWALAENALLNMERDGVLAQNFNIRLGKGFRDDD